MSDAESQAPSTPEPPVVPPIEGGPPQPVTEPDLVRAGRELIAAGDNQWNRWVVLDVAHWLLGELGNPGSGWPVRLPLAACGVHAPAPAIPEIGPVPRDNVQAPDGPPAGFWDENGSTSIGWSVVPAPDTGQAREPAPLRFAWTELLFDELSARGIPLRMLAKPLGLTVPEVEDLIAGERELTGDLAARIGQFLGTSTRLWLNLAAQGPSRDTVQAPDVARRLAIAQVVAEHWRDVAMQWGDDQIPARAAAHPLACVLAAIAGETDDLGVGPGPDADRIRDLLGTDAPEAGQ